jgi:hypothetical protein
LVTSGEKSIVLGLGQMGLLELRGHLAGRRVGDLLIPHLVLVSETFDAHLQKLRSGAAKELRRVREMQQWWRRKNKELEFCM